MVESLFLVTRTSQGTSSDRNRIREVLINSDDALAASAIIAATVAALNAANPVTPGGNPIFPANYFDTVTAIDDLALTSETNLRTDGDFIAFAPRVAAVETEAV